MFRCRGWWGHTGAGVLMQRVVGTHPERGQAAGVIVTGCCCQPPLMRAGWMSSLGNMAAHLAQVLYQAKFPSTAAWPCPSPPNCSPCTRPSTPPLLPDHILPPKLLPPASHPSQAGAPPVLSAGGLRHPPGLPPGGTRDGHLTDCAPPTHPRRGEVVAAPQPPEHGVDRRGRRGTTASGARGGSER